MKKILIFLFVLAIMLTPIVVTPEPASAQGFLDRIVPACNEGALTVPIFNSEGKQVGLGFEENCGMCHIVQLIQNILSFIITISVMVATLMFVYAGFLYLTAGGSADKIKSATKIFSNVFIGLIFVLGAFLIVDTIMKTFFNENTKFGPWNEIECSSRPSRATVPASSGGSIISTSESFIEYDEEDIFVKCDSKGAPYELVGKDKDGNEVRRYIDNKSR
jgi:hypothetical protein